MNIKSEKDKLIIALCEKHNFDMLMVESSK